MNDDQNHTNSSHDSHSAGSHQTESHQTGAMGSDKSLAFPSFNFSKLDFAGQFKKMMDVLMFKNGAIEALASDSSANAVALIFMIIGALVGPIVYSLVGVNFLGVVVRPDLVSSLVNGLFTAAISFVALYITCWVAVKQFKGHGTFEAYFRVMATLYLVNVLSALIYIVPVLGGLISIALGLVLLVIEYKTLQAVFKLDNTNAVLTIVVTILVIFALSALIGMLGIGAAATSAGITSSRVNISY